MLEIVIFILASCPVLYVSRASLRVPRSHGFYRFFAWEAILALAALNLRTWFREPFAWHQIISWCLLMLSLFFVIDGVRLLRRSGRHDETRTDENLYTFEKTAVLVTTGTYGYIRHPLYSSLLFLAWGIAFKQIAWFNGLLALAATLFLLATARVEEGENLLYFGEAYREYMKRSKRFIPFLF